MGVHYFSADLFFLFYHSLAENNGCSVQSPRLCSHISRLQTPALSLICRKSIQGMYHVAVTTFCFDHRNLGQLWCIAANMFGQLIYRKSIMEDTFLALFISLELTSKWTQPILSFPISGHFPCSMNIMQRAIMCLLTIYFVI